MRLKLNEMGRLLLRRRTWDQSVAILGVAASLAASIAGVGLSEWYYYVIVLSMMILLLQAYEVWKAKRMEGLAAQEQFQSVIRGIKNRVDRLSGARTRISVFVSTGADALRLFLRINPDGSVSEEGKLYVRRSTGEISEALRRAASIGAVEAEKLLDEADSPGKVSIAIPLMSRGNALGVLMIDIPAKVVEIDAVTRAVSERLNGVVPTMEAAAALES